MTRQREEHEVQKAATLKAVRSMVRLRHSLEADAELSRVLPRIETEIDAALAAGEVYELDSESFLGS